MKLRTAYSFSAALRSVVCFAVRAEKVMTEKPATKDHKMKSAAYKDEDISNLPLTKIFYEIRQCQILCKQSQKSTFCGSMEEFGEAHRILDRVTRENPQEKQLKLIPKMRALSLDYDDELINRCSDYADKQSGWDYYK
jgi:hypothetical protein